MDNPGELICPNNAPKYHYNILPAMNTFSHKEKNLWSLSSYEASFWLLKLFALLKNEHI